MPNFNNLPLVLADPMLRRVEPAAISVWVALSKSAEIEIGLWRGPIVADTGTGVFGNDTAEHSQTASSIRIGEKLHLALVTLDLSDAPLNAGQIYQSGFRHVRNGRLRRCLKSLMLGNPSYHQVSHGDVNHRLAALREELIILVQSPVNPNNDLAPSRSCS